VSAGVIDLGAIERIERALADLRRDLGTIIDERVCAALDGRDADCVGGLAQLATWIGAPSPEAARKRVERDGDLAALAVRTSGGHRRWRRSEVLALLAGRRGEGR
jgi:hypothetical protein